MSKDPITPNPLRDSSCDSEPADSSRLGDEVPELDGPAELLEDSAAAGIQEPDDENEADRPVTSCRDRPVTSFQR